MKTQTLIVALLAAAANAAAVQPRQNDEIDFGTCTPTMDFQAGRVEFNPKDTKGTFYPIDAGLVGNSTQKDSPDPNVITKFICDRLIRVCKSNDAANVKCADTQEMIKSLGTKDKTTADAWNKALGF